MRLKRKLNRRSFLSAVTGAAVSGGALLRGGEARAQVTDGDPSDPIGRGRGGGPRQQTNTGITDHDPTDRTGYGRGTAGRTNCSDNDPTDSGGDGRHCSTANTGGGDRAGAYQTGRHERRYEVCWVDSPTRSNAECNMLTYSEWQLTWSDGRVEYDYEESRRRIAEMQARGYTPRWHRMLINEWVGLQ